MEAYGYRYCSHSRIFYGVDFQRVKKLFVPREMEELEQQVYIMRVEKNVFCLGRFTRFTSKLDLHYLFWDVGVTTSCNLISISIM
jgi:hypothetical protein